MIFPTASSTPRPIRLSEEIRDWAWRSLHGQYGDEAIRNDSVSLDDFENFEELSSLQQYDAAIQKIARCAPLRICPEERICGAATLGLAIQEIVPVRRGGKPVAYASSHLTLRYDKVLREGLSSYETEIAERLKDAALEDDQIEFLHSLQNTIESIRIWHARYLEETKEARPDLHALLQQVPFSPARNFHEAVQSLWFTFAFTRLCGNWPGIGRVDWLLGDYLENDLRSGVLTLEEAREIYASFFIKGCEWIQSDTPPSSGDAQHYQNIVLAGVDADGEELINTVTYLTLDIVEELSISDYPITVRLNKKTPEKLLRRVAEVMRHGGGIVAIYNEDLVIQAMLNEGYPLREARMFANDGCWEVQVPGKTDFIYMPFDGLQIFNAALGIDGDGTIPHYDSIEEVYQAYLSGLKAKIEELYESTIRTNYVCKDGRWRAAKPVKAASVISLFEDGCIKNAAGYYNFGPKYLVRSPHIGGAPDISNSLYALEKVVFEEKKLSLEEMVQILRNNWDGAETLRQQIKNRYTFYGNDFDEADRWHSRVLDDFADLVKQCAQNRECPAKFIPGVSTFGRQIEWLPKRTATAFGYRKGDILSGNDSPTPGTDSAGATSIIRSCCKADLVKQSCGAALDIKIFPSTLNGENGIAALIALMKGFLELGGFFLQLDSVDIETLRDAQQNPENYKTLSVRVSGWNARFVTLNCEWQNMIIERTAQGIQ